MGSLAMLGAGGSAAGAIGSGAAAANEEIKKQQKASIKEIHPFTEAGQTDLEGLAALVTDPERQKQFIEENPFFEALAGRAEKNITQMAASEGEFASGGTAEALQNAMLLLGDQLLTSDTGRRFNLANMGLSGASMEADIRMGGATQIASNIMTAAGARASGKMADAGAKANFIDQGISFLGI